MFGLFYLSDLERMGGTFEQRTAIKRRLLSSDVIGDITLDQETYRVMVTLFGSGNGKVIKVLSQSKEKKLVAYHMEHLKDQRYSFFVGMRTFCCFSIILLRIVSLIVAFLFLFDGDVSRFCLFLASFVGTYLLSAYANRI